MTTMPAPSARLLLLSLALLLAGGLRAQAPRGLGNLGSGSTGGQRGSSAPMSEAVQRDSFRMAIGSADNPGQREAFADTLFGHFFPHYDPARRQVLDWATLGNLGAPARPIVFALPERRGFELGFRQFDLYKLPLDKLRYFYNNRAFSDLLYSQRGLSQDDFILKTAFARNLGHERSNLSIDYTRISEEGTYERQKSRHTALGLNGRYATPSGRYRLFGGFTYNDFQQLDNGGVTTDTLFGGEFSDVRSNIPVFLASAATRYSETAFGITQYLDLAQRDSLGQQRRHFTLSHQMQYADSRYKFADTAPPADSLYYGSLQTDDRGLRQVLAAQRLSNGLYVSTWRAEEGDDRSSQQRDRLRLGLQHDAHWLQQEAAADTLLNNLFVLGDWQFRPRGFGLDLGGHLGLLDNAGDYKLYAHLAGHWARVGSIEARVVQEQFQPTLRQHRLFASQRRLWENAFAKTQASTLEASLAIAPWRLRVQGRYTLLNNWIYDDAAARPQQSSLPLNLVQLIVEWDWRWGAWHLDNVLAFQRSDLDILRVPALFGKHSAYVEGRLFRRAMLARFGLDLRYTSAYRAPGYQPLVGAFFNQDAQELPFFPAADVFLSFKVQQFRGFLRYEQLTLWLRDDMFYQVPGYPHPDPALRIGLAWQMLD